jgi:VanZ family protein
MTDEVKAPRRRARFLAAAWGGLLFAVTSWPNPPAIAAGGFPIDKVTHFFLYGIEALLLVRAFADGRRGRWPRVLAVVGAMALWGMLDEAHQQWIPGREMESGDLFADLAGTVAGVSAAALLARRTAEGEPAVTSGPSSDRRPRRS